MKTMLSVLNNIKNTCHVDIESANRKYIKHFRYSCIKKADIDLNDLTKYHNSKYYIDINKFFNNHNKAYSYFYEFFITNASDSDLNLPIYIDRNYRHDYVVMKIPYNKIFVQIKVLIKYFEYIEVIYKDIGFKEYGLILEWKEKLLNEFKNAKRIFKKIYTLT